MHSTSLELHIGAFRGSEMLLWKKQLMMMSKTFPGTFCECILQLQSQPNWRNIATQHVNYSNMDFFKGELITEAKIGKIIWEVYDGLMLMTASNALQGGELLWGSMKASLDKINHKCSAFGSHSRGNNWKACKIARWLWCSGSSVMWVFAIMTNAITSPPMKYYCISIPLQKKYMTSC